MKNKKITRKISQGVYVLTTEGGGCIVDAISQVSSSEQPLISVAVNKNNYTNTLLKNNNKFAISVLSKDVNPKIIETFGFYSMKDTNKFEKVKTTNVLELEIIDDSLGYMICEIVDIIDTDTHNLFIGRLIEADLYKDEEVMTYQYYQDHKDELIKIKTENNRIAWICTICGYVYYGETIPDNFTCPICGVNKDLFKKKDF